MLLAIALPFIANADYVLTLWLGDIPQYTVIFAALALIDALVLSITDPLLTAVQAVGKMKVYQLTVGILSLLNLPVAYVALKISNNPLIPFIVAIVLDLFITIGRLVNFKLLHPFSILKYVCHICIPAFFVTVVSSFISMKFLTGATGFGWLVVNVVLCEIVMFVLIIAIGLNKSEREMIKQMLPFSRKVGNNE